MEKLERQAAELNHHFERLMIHIVQTQQVTDGELSDLNKQEANLIFTLGERGVSIMRELADSLRLHVSTMTGIVDKLVEKNLLTRERSDTDRRIVRVSLTPDGENAYQKELAKRTNLSLAMLTPLDADERTTILKIFTKINDALEK